MQKDFLHLEEWLNSQFSWAFLPLAMVYQPLQVVSPAKMSSFFLKFSKTVGSLKVMVSTCHLLDRGLKPAQVQKGR